MQRLTVCYTTAAQVCTRLVRNYFVDEEGGESDDHIVQSYTEQRQHNRSNILIPYNAHTFITSHRCFSIGCFRVHSPVL